MICNRGDELVQIVSVPVGSVSGDDGWRRDFQLFKFVSRIWVVQIEAEVLAVDRVQPTVGKLVDFFTLAKKRAFCKVVGRDDRGV